MVAACRAAPERREGTAAPFRLLPGLLLALAAAGCVDSSRDPPTPAPPAPPPVTEAGETDTEDEEESGDEESGTEEEEAPEPFSTAAMLRNLADAVILPNYEALASGAADFAADDGPVAAYCAAIGTDDEAAARADAQAAWREAMALVQAAEMHVFGPALANGGALRKRVLSYADAPLSTCGVDISAVRAGAEDFSIRTRSANQRGYGALEYLLFNEELEHTCAPQVPDTSDWDELPEADRLLARCGLARLVAADAADAAASLADAWSSDGGDYRAALLDAEASGEALQHLTDGLFALDLLVKDRKLGIPTGIHDDCGENACPELVESRWSGNSFANIRANAASFAAIFEGGDGFGFDDFIVNEEFPEVAARFSANTRAIIDYVDGIDTTLHEQVLAIESEGRGTECVNAFAAADLAAELSACSLLGLVKRVTDDLKIDFVTIVGVSIPGGAQTDND